MGADRGPHCDAGMVLPCPRPGPASGPTSISQRRNGGNQTEVRPPGPGPRQGRLQSVNDGAAGTNPRSDHRSRVRVRADINQSATERPGIAPRSDGRGRARVAADFNHSATERRELIPGPAADAGRSSVPGGPWTTLTHPAAHRGAGLDGPLRHRAEPAGPVPRSSGQRQSTAGAAHTAHGQASSCPAASFLSFAPGLASGVLPGKPCRFPALLPAQAHSTSVPALADTRSSVPALADTRSSVPALADTRPVSRGSPHRPGCAPVPAVRSPNLRPLPSERIAAPGRWWCFPARTSQVRVRGCCCHASGVAESGPLMPDLA
jgi:hypothetical protein